MDYGYSLLCMQKFITLSFVLVYIERHKALQCSLRQSMVFVWNQSWVTELGKGESWCVKKQDGLAGFVA